MILKRLFFGKNIHIIFYPIPIKIYLIYVIVSEKENKQKRKESLDMTDKELQSKLYHIANGDISAFEEVYNDMKTPIMTVIARIVQNRETAEDILQEVFIKLYYSPPVDISKPRAYIFKTASNLAVDYLRKSKQTVSLEDCEGMLYAPESDRSEKLDIERALEKLEDGERQVVTLHINGGFKFREIAEILDMPLGTAVWRYQKAVKRLRELLQAV